MSYKSTGFTISKKQHASIQKIKDLGYYPSNSAIIRYCLNIGLPIIFKEVKELNDFIQNNDLINAFDYLKRNGFTIHKLRQSQKAKPIVSVYANGKNTIIQ